MMLLVIIAYTVLAINICIWVYLIVSKRSNHKSEVPITKEAFINPYIPYSVLELDNMFTKDECESVMAYMNAKMTRSTVVGPTSSANVTPDRTSYTAWLNKTDTDQEHFINKFIGIAAMLTGYRTLDFYEDISIVRYQASEYYREHYDACATTKNCQNNSRIYRKATLIVYLNDGFSGGETSFPKINVKVTPKTGKVAMFYDTDHQGVEIAESLHAGLPVTSGEKWIATLWIKFLPGPTEVEFLDAHN